MLSADDQTLIWRTRLTNGSTAIVKLYHHRGPISWVREHLFQFRVEREFLALTHLDRGGIACSKPLFWTKGKLPQYGGRFEALATEEIPNSVPLLDYIKAADDRHLQPLLGDCGKLIRKMHSRGVFHGALYSRNLLLGGPDRARPLAHIIDTPKAIVFPFDLAGTKLGKIDLINLTYTLAKHGKAQCVAWLLDGYAAPEPARTDLIDRLRGFRPTRHTRNLHRAYSGMLKLATRMLFMLPASSRK